MSIEIVKPERMLISNHVKVFPPSIGQAQLGCLLQKIKTAVQGDALGVLLGDVQGAFAQVGALLLRSRRGRHPDPLHVA
jgi:hypothetical protein